MAFPSEPIMPQRLKLPATEAYSPEGAEMPIYEPRLLNG